MRVSNEYCRQAFESTTNRQIRFISPVVEVLKSAGMLHKSHTWLVFNPRAWIELNSVLVDVRYLTVVGVAA